jgi:glyoxylase-like metal-dependent hydrolase (beta-lactamase superfamily II)
MKKRPIITAAAITFCNVLVILIAPCGHTTAAAAEPDEKAISIVTAALKLLDPAIHKTALIHAEGTVSGNNEGTNPQRSTRTQRLSADWKVDFERRRLLQRNSSYVGNERMWCDQRVTSREIRYDLFCHSNVFSNDGPQPTDGTFIYRMDTTYPDPVWHLTHALEQSKSLHWEGSSFADGQGEDVISYVDEFNNRHRLYVNSATHLLREVSTTAQLTRFDEGYVPRIDFTDYRRAGRYWSPARATIVQASWVMITSELQSIRRDFGGVLSDADFAPPAGAMEMDRKRFEFNVSKVAKSVYFVESASPDYNCMFVVFADYVMVVEAPSSDDASAKVMAAIRDIAPGKPIRYIVPTHFHEDHVGGLRAYMRAGATVLTTPGNLQFVEMLMRKLRSREPQIKLPPVEVIAGRRRFTDGSVTIDLFNVPSAHVDEMVVPFIPSDGIIYVADGFTRDLGPWRPPTIEERTLMGQFKQLGLEMKMVLPGHGPVAQQKDLDEYLSSVGSLMRM